MSRKNQAITREEIVVLKKKRQKLILRVTYTILILSVLIWIVSFVRQLDLFQINHISISGQYNKLNPQTLTTLVKPLVHQNLLTLDKTNVKQKLVKLPWVQSVEIKRDWPHKLNISFTEKTAVAMWQSKGLISADGEIFFPNKNTFPNGLPDINAPADLIPEALNTLGTMDTLLSVQNLSIKKIIVKQRDDVSIVLSNGLQVLLGRDNRLERLQRFIDIYPKVFANRLNQVQYVDMRYTNGMAVKWRNQTEK